MNEMKTKASKRVMIKIIMPYFLGLLCCFAISSTFAQVIPAVYQNLKGEYDKNNFTACVKMESEVEIFSKTQHDTLVANSFSYLGDAFNQTGQLDKAIVWFEREKDLRASLGLTGTAPFSSALYNLAFLNLQAGHYTQADLVATQLIENDKKLYGLTSAEFTSSVISTIDIYIQLDKFDEAERLLQSTLKHQPKNSYNQGVLLSKLSDLYTLTNQFSKASKALRTALSVLEKTVGKTAPEYIGATINQGILYMSRGQFPEAEETFDFTLGVMNKKDQGYIATLNNQALVYQSLGQLDRAEKTFREIKSSDSVSLGATHPDFAVTLSNLGLVYGDEGKYKEAEKTLLQALEIQKKNSESKTVSYARKLNNLAKIYRLSGKPEKAIPLLEQALSIFKNKLGENSPEYATTAFNLGMAYWKAGRGALGIRYLKTSASIRAAKLGKKHPKYAESIQKIGEYQWEQKQLKDASLSFGEVFNNYYYQIDVTFPVLTEEEKAKFYYTNIKPSLDKFNSFAMAYRAENPLVIGDVYNNQINTKAAIMYATEKVKEAIMLSKDTVLINEFELWQAQKERIAKLFGQNIEDKQLDSLVALTSRIEKDLARKSSVFANQMVKKQSSWQEIQKTLKNDEAAVEVIRFKSYSPSKGGNFEDKIIYAFLVLTSSTKEKPDLILIDNGNLLEGKFLNYYKNNIHFNLDDHKSYENYFGPLADYLKGNQINKVYFSPDGVYNQINVNTISDPIEHKFVLDEYDVRLLTNTRELVERKAIETKQQTAVLMGFPKFNLNNALAVASSSETRSFTRESSTLTRGLRGGLLRYMQGSEGIAVLPGTQKEIQEISKLAEHSQIYLEEKASEESLKKVNSPTVLHIATHGYFLADEKDIDQKITDGKTTYVPNPLLKAGIILAGAENFLKTGVAVDAAGNDGILTAYEAMNLNLDKTELVVLSACETGLGTVKNGEGVYGLQRAFKLAGAQHIIMSLWNVDDDATQALMSIFYEEKLKTSDMAVAFRNAQLKLREKHAHPFYWGAFIMIGL